MNYSSICGFLFFILTLLLPLSNTSARQPIVNFTINKELGTTHILHIQALDTLGNIDGRINGSYTFEINGFEKSLHFSDGKCNYPDELKSSTFLYMKWQGTQRPVPKLFFVLSNDLGLLPVGISFWWLVIIPVTLVVLSFIFKKLVYVVLVVVVLFFALNKGLSVESYAVAIKDWVLSHI